MRPGRRQVNIPNEAIEAAAEAMYEFKYENRGWDEAKSPDAWRAHALVTLEAAAPHLLKNMRQLDLYEIEMRDNPERMKAARSRMREETRAVRAEENKAWAEQTRLDQEGAFDAGFTACAHEHTKQRQDPTYPITRINPYRAEANSLWAVLARSDREAARAAMEADLNKHFPNLATWGDKYQVSCDATGCYFSTGIGYYGALMSQWNGHIAEILSISGDHS